MRPPGKDESRTICSLTSITDHVRAVDNFIVVRAFGAVLRFWEFLILGELLGGLRTSAGRVRFVSRCGVFDVRIRRASSTRDSLPMNHYPWMDGWRLFHLSTLPRSGDRSA